MEINYQFTVNTPIDRAWDTMLDLERIAPCLPGAEIQEKRGEGEYAGTIGVKIGPIRARYEGTARFEEADEANHRAVLRATGRDVRGQDTASATIVSTLREAGDETMVNVETDLTLTGRAAQFGRGIAQDVATRMLDQFAVCLEREISATSGRAPEAAMGPADDPAPSSTTGTAASGATVEGAVVAGPGPTEAAASAPTTGIRQPTTQEIPRRELGPPESPAEFDAGPAGRDDLLKSATPILLAAGALAVLFWMFRGRR